MIVSPNEPFELVFSLYQHEYLGCLLESYVVKLNAKGEVTYHTQNVSVKNITEFEAGLSSTAMELVRYTDRIQQDEILRKFNTKKLSTLDFFKKVFDPEKGDKLLKETILDYIDRLKKEVFERITDHRLFMMGSDGIPTWKEIRIIKPAAKAYFHFEKYEDHTLYYPVIRCGEERLKFQFKNAVIINDLPAAMLLDEKLYLFDDFADGKKIRPFLNKANIVIPKKVEETYYHKFIVPLVANFNVFAKGFEIINHKKPLKAFLKIEEITEVPAFSIFDTDTDILEAPNRFIVGLGFRYGDFEFKYDNFASPAHVKLSRENEQWVFHKVNKEYQREKGILLALKEIGLDLRNGRTAIEKYKLVHWLNQNTDFLSEKEIEVIQSSNNLQNLFFGKTKIEIRLEEKNDWFDIYAKVKFGSFEIPFQKIRKYILSNKREFELPNGQIALIPEEWFTKYSELFNILTLLDDSDQPILKKQHIGLLNYLESDDLSVKVMEGKLQKLKGFEDIESIKLPIGFKGKLRPYQKAGYDWLHFLKNYHFGGCLADDMGLGKTVTTLAFLQKVTEEEKSRPSLLVMPTSLIYNWQKEARKFTPKLKILVHFGTNRAKNTSAFDFNDLVICSYGILRIDIDFMKDYSFNYVVLDESQAIKNPGSIIHKSVMKLNSQNRLLLTGTPIENSTMDLWSQMSFANPGLLGTQKYFKTYYQSQIERQKDEQTLKKLYAKIKPFILRRQKNQVAKDLPEKIEMVQYCQMTEEQRKLYEETKSYIRNQLLEEIAHSQGLRKSNMLILQGLTKLRQLANNPCMLDPDFKGGSGKDDDVFYKLADVVSKGYKTLVFSQFVKHLGLVAAKLKQEGINFLYLDGGTKNRMEVVEEFQKNDDIKVFLISLKAGGVGLNLTAAEYVFLLDPWWNPAIEAQAIDRAHRIGQINTVFSYKFITQNTVEEKILDLQNSKKKLLDDLITAEDGFLKSLNEDDILALLD